VTRPRSAAPAEARLDDALWRAVTVFRVAALLYALTAIAFSFSGYDDSSAALAVGLVMVAWTAVMLVRVPPPLWLMVADVVVALACQQASVLALSDAQIDRGDPTLTVSWVAVPVVAWAVRSGWVGGGVAAAVLSAGAVVERGGLSQATVNSVALLVLAGTIVGYLVELGRRAEGTYAEAVRLQAETAERERLARDVHDGVLQTLALVARRSADPSLVSLATGQEQALRRLVAGPAVALNGASDLRLLLPARPGVEVAAPASAVVLPADVASELAAAVAAAVDNALQHGGTTAWLLVEDLPDAVIVSVRDDGPGIPAGRLAAAEADGRMGVARSIRGRIADLGGTVEACGGGRPPDLA
jgi:signal transduction histidine kinase